MGITRGRDMAFKSTTADAQANADREAAQTASRDCPFCQGQGLVTVYHPAFTGDTVGFTKDGRPFPATIAAHCRCLLGAWIRDHVLPEIQARIPRVEDICTGRSKWLLTPPHEPPAPNDDHPITRQSFARGRDLARSLRIGSRIEDGPLCPRCQHPMFGGRGGLPWTCFRGCKTTTTTGP